MGHSTGAENQLNRLKPGQTFGSAEYAREELVAELGAALVAQRYGMTKNIKEDSAAYLKSWLNSLHESPDFLKTTLFDVKRSTGMITQRIDKIALDIEQGIDTARSEAKKKPSQIARLLNKTSLYWKLSLPRPCPKKSQKRALKKNGTTTEDVDLSVF